LLRRKLPKVKPHDRNWTQLVNKLSELLLSDHARIRPLFTAGFRQRMMNQARPAGREAGVMSLILRAVPAANASPNNTDSEQEATRWRQTGAKAHPALLGTGPTHVWEMFMRFQNSFPPAIVGYLIVASAAFAQPQTVDTKTKAHATPTQPSRAANQSGSAADASPDGARKQPTQGLPSSLTPDTSSSWDSTRQPSKTQ
jgi:hypothetical protein